MQELQYRDILRQVLAGQSLSRQQARWAFDQIMEGLWNEAQIAGLLIAMAARGESVDEIAGAASAMRQHVTPIDAGGADVLDTCGTGGTGISTFNISTAAAIVAAGAGAKVAKHGNRTATRASGSADVLAQLGVNIDASPQAVARCLREANVCFCFAVRCHPAMKYAVPVRKALGVRTIFNLLGPLTNPAGARRQLMGVFEPALTPRIAQVLGMLGAHHAMVVHSQDGLDEISIAAPTHVSIWRNGAVTTQLLQPEELGIKRSSIGQVLVKSAQESAQAVREVLSGAQGARRDIVLVNAGAALVVAGAAESIPAGIELARASIDSGAAARCLDRLVELSNQPTTLPL